MHLDMYDSQRSFKCPFADALFNRDSIGQFTLAKELIMLQQALCYEELGDVIGTGPEIVQGAVERSGINLAGNEAELLAAGLVSCLQNRYMGTCAELRCSGREDVSRIISDATTKEAAKV